MEYLVAVELGCGSDAPSIKVTDDIEGFGPGLLAGYPILTIEADTPQLAGYRYARQHELTHILITINLESDSSEWWMEQCQAHMIDPEVGAIWEPKE